MIAENIRMLSQIGEGLVRLPADRPLTTLRFLDEARAPGPWARVSAAFGRGMTLGS